MRALVSLHNPVFGALEAAAPLLIPTLARLVFAGTLLIYFWNSGLTKWGSGPFSPDLGAYIQILPRAFDAVGYDPSALGPLATAIVSFRHLGGVHPARAGRPRPFHPHRRARHDRLRHRPDLGRHHGPRRGPETIGAWFNNTSGDAILDQRAFWIFLLIVLVLRGAGPAVARCAPRGATEATTSPSRPSRGEAPRRPSRSPAASSPRDARPGDRGTGCARRLRQTRARSWSACSPAVPEGPRNRARVASSSGVSRTSTSTASCPASPRLRIAFRQVSQLRNP
jgi:putative oxidoreductase